MEEKSLVELINTAIQREEDAYRFYMDLHDKFEDPGVKDTLAWIAEEEKKHKAFLVNYRDGKYSEESMPKRDIKYYKLAEHQDEPEIDTDMQSQDVFLVAAHREMRSHRFYSELADLQVQDEPKDMLQKMANEELKHKEKMEYLYANTAFPQTDGG